jgi:hypothetical protein
MMGQRGRRPVAFRSTANQAAIAAAGGIDAVVVAMARYPDDHEVQDECFEALCYLAEEESPANQAAIAKAGGAELAAAAIEKWQGLANQHAFQRCHFNAASVSSTACPRKIMRSPSGIYLYLDRLQQPSRALALLRYSGHRNSPRGGIR